MKRKWKISAGNRTRQKNDSGQKELAVPTAFPASNITIIFSVIQQLQKKTCFPFVAAAKRHFSYEFMLCFSGECSTAWKIIKINLLWQLSQLKAIIKLFLMRSSAIESFVYVCI